MGGTPGVAVLFSVLHSLIRVEAGLVSITSGLPVNRRNVGFPSRAGRNRSATDGAFLIPQSGQAKRL
jgi:hypothetical protein